MACSWLLGLVQTFYSLTIVAVPFISTYSLVEETTNQCRQNKSTGFSVLLSFMENLEPVNPS